MNIKNCTPQTATYQVWDWLKRKAIGEYVFTHEVNMAMPYLTNNQISAALVRFEKFGFIKACIDPAMRQQCNLKGSTKLWRVIAAINDAGYNFRDSKAIGVKRNRKTSLKASYYANVANDAESIVATIDRLGDMLLEAWETIDQLKVQLTEEVDKDVKERSS